MAELISLDRIRREAQDAATRYHDVNEACPYPFATDAAHAFHAEFILARYVLSKSRRDTEGAAA